MTSNPLVEQLDTAAGLVVELLQRRRKSGRDATIVLAESCTAGLIAATLGRIAGVSEFFAGSAVVYQIHTKASWLGIDLSLLHDPGPVSRIVAEQMAEGVLQRTAHATIALSITGHLGPAAPEGLDGVAWCAVARNHAATQATMFQLSSRFDDAECDVADSAEWRSPPASGLAVRHHRQQLATLYALRFLTEQLTDL